MAELGTIIRQVNKETYLDLSSANLIQDNFIDDFKAFTSSKAKFLNGTTLSLVLPESINEEDEKLSSVIEQIQEELNKRNISLKRARKQKEAVEETVKEAPQEPSKQEAKSNDEAAIPAEMRKLLGRGNTLYIKTNLRAGQEIQHPGDVVVFGDVNNSAEIVASGDIVVWGRLRGVVHAGAEGDDNAVIAALKMDAGQIRISDRLIVINNPPETNKKSKAKPDFVPEIAKIVDNEVVIESFA